MTSATAAVHRPRFALTRLASGLRREVPLFLAGLALIALHVFDDNFAHPEPGMSASDHLLSGLVPLALLALAGWAYPRLSGGRRGALALLLGVFGVVGGIEAAHYGSTTGLAGDDYTGLLSMLAGALLLAVGVVTLWRTRRVEGNLGLRYGRRGLYGLAGLLVLMFVVFPVGLAYVTSHTGRAVVPAPHLGADYERVSFTTSDGLELRGWFIPSRNGAAVISFPGRRGPQKPARVLARHGYGVLLFDRRGEGESDGEPNAYGWNGGRDLDAAIEFLQRRPDVDPRRIGGIGLSVGGELMLEVAARNQALRAVIAEGAGGRTAREDAQMPNAEWMGTALNSVRDVALGVFTNHNRPPRLTDVVSEIAPRPVFLIHSTHGVDSEVLNKQFQAQAPQTTTRWELPVGGHMSAITVRPAEYEQRVSTFFDHALLDG